MTASRMVAAVLLAALATSATATSARGGALDAKIQAEQRRLHDVHLRLHEKRSQLESAKARVGDLQSQLAATNANIARVQGHVGELGAQIDSTRRKLAFNRLQLAAAQKTLQRHNDALRRRLIDAYESGDLGYVAVMLQAKSFGDFVERWNDIRYVIKANEATIRQRRSDETAVRGIQSHLLGDEAALQNAQAQADQEKRALDGLALQRQNLLAVADNERQSVSHEVAQLDDMSESEEASLEALIRAKQAEEEARRLAARRAAQLAGEALPPEPGAPGQLAWPVSGPITSPFGMRVHPVYGRPILHKGIDIAAPSGTTIGAAADGRIIVASYQGDCGNMVAIDHHGGLSTIYCHMSQIFVGVGQDVQRGQAIGAVGMTGDATGPHVHFQVMQAGHPVDPMSFLR